MMPQAFIAALALFALQIGILAGPVEPRVRIVAYGPDQTVALPVGVGFAAVIELSPDEEVDSVIVGNSTAWQVTTTGRGDRIIVKPLTANVATNMIVVTGTRRYVFMLEPADGSNPTPFVLRFVYPAPVPLKSDGISTSAQYRLRGNKELFPIEMHDDGQRTSVTWDKQTALPAIFAVDKRGKEAIVNGRMEDRTYVIQGVSARFVFRLGKAQATATRHRSDDRK